MIKKFFPSNIMDIMVPITLTGTIFSSDIDKLIFTESDIYTKIIDEIEINGQKLVLHCDTFNSKYSSKTVQCAMNIPHYNYVLHPTYPRLVFFNNFITDVSGKLLLCYIGDLSINTINIYIHKDIIFDKRFYNYLLNLLEDKDHLIYLNIYNYDIQVLSKHRLSAVFDIKKYIDNLIQTTIEADSTLINFKIIEETVQENIEKLFNGTESTPEETTVNNVNHDEVEYMVPF